MESNSPIERRESVILEPLLGREPSTPVNAVANVVSSKRLAFARATVILMPVLLVTIYVVFCLNAVSANAPSASSSFADLHAFRPRPQSSVAIPSSFSKVVNIGVISQPIGDMRGTPLHKLGSSYMAASYVKWLESAGAHVIPIPFDTPAQEIEELLPQLNGVVLMGGAILTPHYFDLVKKILKTSMSLSQQGQYLPVWGTCQGFEAMIAAFVDSEDPLSILTHIDGVNQTMTVPSAHLQAPSRMFATIPKTFPSTVDDFRVFHNHELGVLVSDFQKSAALTDMFDVVAHQVDRQGKVFVTAIEAKKYPFYAVQWHPEKPQFEYNTMAIDHSPNSLLAAQYLASFFVSESRKSQNTMSPATQHSMSVYSQCPVYTGLTITAFQQTYFFGEGREDESLDEDGVHVQPPPGIM
eukprot:GILK01010828.1.p1 GENE.GILK01010828.1~~GILK01010828.1.p1  ORF type:complete len:411 (-),score=49.06 GILK01010828.1:76-1308(-)